MFVIRCQQPRLHIFKRCCRELIISFVLGAVPVLASSESARALETMINALLAAVPLMKYYFSLLVVFAVAGVVRHRWNFRPGRYQKGLLALCRFLGDIGSPFLSAMRTAAGALLGFAAVCCFIKPEIFSLTGVLVTLAVATILIVVSAFLAAAEEMLKDPRGASAQN